MDEEKINKYGRITAGLYGEKIISFVQSAENGVRQNTPKFKCVNPITGESCERLYNPFYIIELLENKGFQAKVDKPFFGFTNNHKGFKKIIAFLIESLHPLSLLISPFYFIKAQKH